MSRARLCPLLVWTIAVAWWFASAPSVSAQVTYTVTFADPNNLSTAIDRANMTAAVHAAGADWARYFKTNGGPVNLSVQITMTTDFPRATGSSGTTAYVNTVNNIDVFEQSAARKLRTGTLDFVPPFDIVMNMNPNYLHNNLFFEANPASRSAAIPPNRTDAYSVFLHELGHAFAFNGWRDPDGVLRTPANPLQYQSTWDRFITVEANGDILFRGPNAMAVYGGPVAITDGNPSHYGNDAGSGRPGADLVPGLMNGVVFFFQNRYSISALDLAIAKDAGLDLAPFRWTVDSGAWDAAANWNALPTAGPNAVVPNGTPFDARIDRVTGTPYSVTLNGPVSLNSFALASPDATLLHTGGTFSAPTVNLASGVYRLDGGLVSGGAWTSSGGTLRATANTSNAIQGVTLGANVLDLSPANSYARLIGGTQFATPTAGTTVGASSVLALSQPSLNQGTITLAGGSVAIEGTQFVTLGPNVTVVVAAPAATGSVGRYAAVTGVGELLNQGTLVAAGTNSTLTINPTGAFTNTGTIRTTDPTARVHIQPGGAFTNGGTVNASGTVTGNVTNTGGLFNFNGTVSGGLVVTGGAVGAGPDGPGTLTVGSASFRPGGAYRWQVKDWSPGAAAGEGYDRITSDGALDLSQLTGPGQFTIKVIGLGQTNLPGTVSGFDPHTARSWVIAHFANDLSGVPADRFALDTSEFTSFNSLEGGSFTLVMSDTGDMMLAFTPVPEPALMLGLAVAGLGAHTVWRRRSSRLALAA